MTRPFSFRRGFFLATLSLLSLLSGLSSISVRAQPVGEYCVSSGSSQNYEYISRVQVGGLDNSSGSSAYSDFTSITATVTAGGDAAVTLTPGFVGASYSERWSIWIDFNNDGDFDDAGEEVFAQTGSTVVNGSIAVPASASGTTRMRVSMRYKNSPPTCGTFDYGEVEDFTVTIVGVVPQPPVAAFGASATSVSVGGAVNFTDESTHTPTAWEWTFAGGTPSASTEPNPVVTYSSSGTYAVVLTVSNAAGSDTETKSGYITVSETPIVYCSSSGNNQDYEYISRVMVGDLDNPSGASGYSDFTGQMATVSAGESAGVALTPGFTGGAYTEYWEVWIDFNVDGDFDDAGESVFSGSGSSSLSGSFVVPASSSGSTRMRVSMRYDGTPASCGSFQYGEVEDYTVHITSIEPQPPLAGFISNATTVVIGGSVQFTDQSSNAPDSCEWIFEGGTPAVSTDPAPSVTYGSAGTYDVLLTVSNTAGSDTLVKSGYIEVSATPIVYCTSSAGDQSYEYIGRVQVGDLDNSSGASGYSDFTDMISNLTAGESANVTLTPGFTGNSYVESWRIRIDFNVDGDFDDTGEEVLSGSGSSSVSGTIAVPASASGTTRMRVSMRYGDTPASCGSFTYGEVEDYKVQIQNGPVAAFDSAVDDFSVSFSDQSTIVDGSIVGWNWDFGDGNTSTTQDPVHTYGAQDTYTVTLVVTDDAGETDTATQTIAVPLFEQPNILLIIGDDLGIDTATDLYPGLLDSLYAIYGDSGVYGTPAHMPVVLERIAQQGMVFSNAYAQPLCSPTRAALLTGLYAAKTDVLAPGDPLDADHVNFVRMLKEDAGYHTALFGKWHLGTGSDWNDGGALPLVAGFELFRGNTAGAVSDFWGHDYQVQTDPANPTVISSGSSPSRSLPGIASTTYAPVVKAADTIDWINAQDGPWLAWLSFNNSHTPLHVPNADTLSATALAEVSACGGSPGTNSTGSCSNAVLVRSMTNAMDTLIGKVLDVVETLDSDTYVIFVGDNGTVRGSIDNMWLTTSARGKGSVYESGTRVAMAIRGPEIATGSTSDEFVHVADLFATCLEIGGLVPPAQNTRYNSTSVVDSDSIALTPILFGSAESVRDPDQGYVLTERTDDAGARNGTYKLTCDNGLGACEFYNLIDDPLEEYPLSTPADCASYDTTWTTADPQWHYCRLLEVIQDESHL